MCPEIKEGVLLRGCVAKWAAFFLFFTAIALYIDFVGVLGPSTSIPNRLTKFVNLHELLPPKLHLLETFILLAFFTQVFLYRAAGKEGRKWVNLFSLCF